MLEASKSAMRRQSVSSDSRSPFLAFRMSLLKGLEALRCLVG